VIGLRKNYKELLGKCFTHLILYCKRNLLFHTIFKSFLPFGLPSAGSLLPTYLFCTQRDLTLQPSLFNPKQVAGVPARRLACDNTTNLVMLHESCRSSICRVIIEETGRNVNEKATSGSLDESSFSSQPWQKTDQDQGRSSEATQSPNSSSGY